MAVLSQALDGIRPMVEARDRRAAMHERASEFVARAFISALFVLLASKIGAEFATTGHLTGLLLLPYLIDSLGISAPVAHLAGER